jgi:hypothetical protein
MSLRGPKWTEDFMKDIIFIAVTLAFFALAVGYVRFCDRIR